MQTRWKNLRDRFVKIKKRRRTETGLAADDAPEAWPHFTSMTFIDSTTASNRLLKLCFLIDFAVRERPISCPSSSRLVK